MPRRSDPAPGSDIAMAQIVSADVTPGSQRSRCSGVVRSRRYGAMMSLSSPKYPLAAPVCATSSESTAFKRKSESPAPPSSSGAENPSSPCPAALRQNSRSTAPAASHSSVWGTASLSRKPRVEARKSSCTSLKIGELGEHVLGVLAWHRRRSLDGARGAAEARHRRGLEHAAVFGVGAARRDVRMPRCLVHPQRGCEARVGALELGAPLVLRPLGEELRQPRAERGPAVAVPLRPLGLVEPEALEQQRVELRLDGRDGDEAAVGGLVRAVPGRRAVEEVAPALPRPL